MLITLDEAKLQLRMLDDYDDTLILFCIDSAIDIVQRHIDKEMVNSFDGIDQALIDSNKVTLFSPGLKKATLILITHLFEHPELVTDEAIRVVPMSYRYILDQHRTPGIG